MRTWKFPTIFAILVSQILKCQNSFANFLTTVLVSHFTNIGLRKKLPAKFLKLQSISLTLCAHIREAPKGFWCSSVCQMMALNEWNRLVFVRSLYDEVRLSSRQFRPNCALEWDFYLAGLGSCNMVWLAGPARAQSYCASASYRTVKNLSRFPITFPLRNNCEILTLLCNKKSLKDPIAA